MKRRIVHQWRDWLLKYIGGDKYELIKNDNTERVEIVPCVDGWPGYEETVLEFKKIYYEPSRDGEVLIETKWSRDGMFFT